MYLHNKSMDEKLHIQIHGSVAFGKNKVDFNFLSCMYLEEIWFEVNMNMLIQGGTYVGIDYIILRILLKF